MCRRASSRRRVLVGEHIGFDVVVDTGPERVAPLASTVAIRVGSSELFPADRYRRAVVRVTGDRLIVKRKDVAPNNYVYISIKSGKRHFIYDSCAVVAHRLLGEHAEPVALPLPPADQAQGPGTGKR